MTLPVHLLCAGAAKGLVQALADRLAADCGVHIEGQFGAVGAMREALLAGAACDVMVVTDSMLQALADAGHLRGDTRTPLGRVKTGIAVCAGQRAPDIATPAALKLALLAADSIYFPDPERATAGIHFAQVMRQLGVFDPCVQRFRTFANGATAMREMALAGSKQAIGCTQVSEILYTPGVRLAGALPTEFELATLYSAAVSTHATDPALAAQVIALLAGEASASLRRDGGFEPE